MGVKDISIKNRTYYLFNHIINIKDNIKIVENFIQKCSYSVNPLYLVFDDVNGYVEKINGNK